MNKELQNNSTDSTKNEMLSSFIARWKEYKSKAPKGSRLADISPNELQDLKTKIANSLAWD